jgi:hypothetical protein
MLGQEAQLGHPTPQFTTVFFFWIFFFFFGGGGSECEETDIRRENEPEGDGRSLWEMAGSGKAGFALPGGLEGPPAGEVEGDVRCY